MAGGEDFYRRVITYVANEFIVKGLSNSRTFQRFAVMTTKRFQEISETASQKKEELAEQIKDVSKNFKPFKRR